MKTLSRVLAALLSVTLASQPALAQFSRGVVRPVPVTAATPGAAAVGGTIRLQMPSANLGAPGLALPSLSPVLGALPSPAVAPQASASALGASPVAQTVAASPASPAAAAAAEAAPRAEAPKAVAERLTVMGRSAAEAVRGLSSLPQGGARQAATVQFSALTGEGLSRPAASVADPVAVPQTLGAFKAARLWAANAATQEQPAADAPPAPKKSWKQVFNEPERNKAFWRYFLGSSVFLFGFQMYMVALPYLIKSFVQNTTKEAGRTVTAEQLTELVRQNRSMSRIAHWTAQAVAYVAVPMFNDGQSGPRKWLVRSLLTRAAVLAAVPALFFATGLMSGAAAMWTLFGLIGVQSFFQGLSVTMESGATTRIFGDKSVTPEERLRANSILSFTSAIIAIIAPAIAGRISAMPDWFGKMGTGSALLYGIYAAAVGVAGLIYATIKMLGEPKKESAYGTAGTDEQAARPNSLWSALKGVGTSMKEGIKLVLKNRFLRTLLGLNLIVSLFSDPLVFNVLPEFVEGVLKTSPGAINWALGIPGLGWFLQGLISTPMGFFGLLVAFSSIGSALVALSVEPLRKLFKRLGFKTEESLTIPFYAIAFLEIPAFWGMIYFPSFWGVLLLYGLQTLAGGFVGLIISGIYQEQLGDYSSKQLNQVLAANSFVSIIAAIASTYLYGFVLTGISIHTSLMIAAIATTILGLLRLGAPWMLFSKAQRKGEPEQTTFKPHEKPVPHEDGSHGTKHLPGKQGPLSIGL
ncbi:MAG: hypothetical protein HY928_14395 [Elusimicrobia bacterium]|nr:hypothetical protein [Elusimicrobiota bacterium]